MMLFAIATSSIAKSSVYLDYLIGETDSPIDSSLMSDNYFALGGKYQFGNNWSVSGEYTKGRMYSPMVVYGIGNGIVEDKITTYTIKGSYAVVDNKDLRLDLSAGYYIDNEKYSAERIGYHTESEFESYFLGAEALFNLTNKLTVSAGFEYGLLGTATAKINNTRETEDLESLLNYKVAFIYYLANHLGLSLGYRSSSCEVDDGKTTTSGLTLGVTYKL